METYTTQNPIHTAIKYIVSGFFMGFVTMGITFAILHSAYADPDALQVARAANSESWNKADEIKGLCSRIVTVTEQIKSVNSEVGKVIDRQYPKQ